MAKKKVKEAVKASGVKVSLYYNQDAAQGERFQKVAGKQLPARGFAALTEPIDETEAENFIGYILEKEEDEPRFGAVRRDWFRYLKSIESEKAKK